MDLKSSMWVWFVLCCDSYGVCVFQAEQWASASRERWLPCLAALPRGAGLLSVCLTCRTQRHPQPNHAVCPAAGRHARSEEEHEHQFVKTTQLQPLSSFCVYRLTPLLLWRASLLRPTALPTTHQARGIPSPFNRACTPRWAGNEIHSVLTQEYTSLLTPNSQPVRLLCSWKDLVFNLEHWGAQHIGGFGDVTARATFTTENCANCWRMGL